MGDVCRVLRTDLEVERFVEGVLDITSSNEKREAINRITAAERNITEYSYFPTFTHRDNRDFEWRDERKRDKLRKQIIDELYCMERLIDEDSICLSKGGSAPISGAQKEKRCFYVIGPPASGKSGVSSKIAEQFHAYILDADFAKRKLPEFNNQIGSAALVHEESSQLVFNTSGDSLMSRCLKDGYNIVIPKIGDDIDKVILLCKGLNEAGYSVYLVSVSLDRQKATFRAYSRYKETGRYVPLSLVFDKYSNQPTLNYFRLKQQFSSIFFGFAEISTDVEKGSPAKLLENLNIQGLTDIDWR